MVDIQVLFTRIGVFLFSIATVFAIFASMLFLAKKIASGNSGQEESKI